MIDLDEGQIDSLENKKKVLEIFLVNSGIYGWNVNTLLRSVVEAGFRENYVYLIFPDELKELMELFFDINNKAMADFVKSQDLSQLKVRERVKLAIRFYLENNFTHKKSLQKLAKFFARTKNVILGLRFAYKVADLVWFAIGDRSTDFNFYSKRVILTRILVRIFRFLVEDKSDDFEVIMDFVDLEIEKTMRIQILKFKMKDYFSRAKSCSDEFLEHGLSRSLFSKGFKKLPFIRLFNKDL